MKSEMPFRGVPSPALKRLLRPLLAGQAARRGDVARHRPGAVGQGAPSARSGTPRSPWPATGCIASTVRPHTLDLYEHLIRTGAWWDLVDETAHLVRDVLLAHPDEVAPVIREWAVADDLWVRRTAIICQVGAKDRCDQATAGRGDRGQPRRLDADHAGGLAVRPGVLHPQGHRLGAARPRPRRPGLGAWPSSTRHDDQLSGLSRREALKHLGGRAGRDLAVDVPDPRRRASGRARGCRSRAPGRARGPGRRPRCPPRRCAWRRPAPRAVPRRTSSAM